MDGEKAESILKKYNLEEKLRENLRKKPEVRGEE